MSGIHMDTCRRELCSKDEQARTYRERTNAYFEACSSFWTEVYVRPDVDGAVYRDRSSAVLALVRKLALPDDCAILEIGCGSGLISVRLAQTGYTIHAVDSAEAMIRSTRDHAQQAGVNGRIIIAKADAEKLEFANNSFDLVLTIGVAPWLSSLHKAVAEIIRVLRPGGYLIITADNRWRLTHWLDPRFFPPLGAVRERIRAMLELVGILRRRQASARLHSIEEFDASLSKAGLNKIEGRTVGFGPFTFIGCKLLPNPWAVRAHQWLQHLADGGARMVRSAGTQYIVLARKPVLSPEVRIHEHD